MSYRLLMWMGCDPTLYKRLAVSDQRHLRMDALVWLWSCLVLGASSAYAAYLVLPGAGLPIFAGVGVTLLMLTLLRVVFAGGGVEVEGDLEDGRRLSRRYRPSVIPAFVFGGIALLLAQPAQLPFWRTIEPQVEAHRHELIRKHEEAARSLGTDPGYYGDELRQAGFPIYRLKKVWEHPKDALRWTFVIALLVLFPALWSQVISLRSRRAYEWERFQRQHAQRESIRAQGERIASEFIARYTQGAAQGGPHG